MTRTVPEGYNNFSGSRVIDNALNQLKFLARHNISGLLLRALGRSQQYSVPLPLALGQQASYRRAVFLIRLNAS